MPSPDGIEITRLVRASGCNQKTPVIIISGEEDPSVLTRGFHAGANFFLYKPVNKERLLNLARTTHSAVQAEKRHYQRVVVTRNVRLLSDHDVIGGETIDISLNGMLVRADRTFAPGSHVIVRRFLTPTEPPITSEGKVVRLTGPHMGIHLDTMGLGASRRLQDFLLPLLWAGTHAQVDLQG
jgi:hypothetical protein